LKNWIVILRKKDKMRISSIFASEIPVAFSLENSLKSTLKGTREAQFLHGEI
jgi:hypothetical protein